jgi:hypothetical protein
VPLISIAAMGHPTAQHLEDFAFSGHGIAPNKGAAPKATKSSVATNLEKIFMPVLLTTTQGWNENSSPPRQ